MSAPPGSDTAQQLQQLRQQVALGNPELYRHWALYLQVLREGLGPAVDQACFHLAAGLYPQRYQQLEQSRRLQLHRRITSLVRRSCALLTVEQLQALAQQMRQRERRQLLRSRRQWLQRLKESPRPDTTPAAAPADEEPAPQGSVHLGLALPISATFLGMEPAAEPHGPAAEEEGVAADLLGAFSRLLEEAGDATSAPALQAESDDGLLPTEPIALLAWINGLEAALGRRLRTLSHALNVELVRSGLSTTLLPLRLLEAVATGQVDSHNTAANLVRLSIPMPSPAGEGGLETQALLLRPTDLEAEQPRLRTCRGRLQQVQQELRRMAHTYQRLEQRLQVQQAEQLWLNDHSTALSPPP